MYYFEFRKKKHGVNDMFTMNIEPIYCIAFFQILKRNKYVCIRYPFLNR